MASALAASAPDVRSDRYSSFASYSKEWREGKIRHIRVLEGDEYLEGLKVLRIWRSIYLHFPGVMGKDAEYAADRCDRLDEFATAESEKTFLIVAENEKRIPQAFARVKNSGKEFSIEALVVAPWNHALAHHHAESVSRPFLKELASRYASTHEELVSLVRGTGALMMYIIYQRARECGKESISVASLSTSCGFYRALGMTLDEEDDCFSYAVSAEAPAALVEKVRKYFPSSVE